MRARKVRTARCATRSTIQAPMMMAVMRMNDTAAMPRLCKTEARSASIFCRPVIPRCPKALRGERRR